MLGLVGQSVNQSVKNQSGNPIPF